MANFGQYRTILDNMDNSGRWKIRTTLDSRDNFGQYGQFKENVDNLRKMWTTFDFVDKIEEF